MLLTTSVGSFPKPDYLKAARAKVRRGQMSPEELRRLEERATEEWIRAQEEIGLDILVDGEMYRGDMATYFSENMDGFAISGLVRSYGNRYYRKPMAVGQVRWRQPMTVGWFQFAQARTQKPVKGMVTGPYTLMDWCFNESYPTRRALALDLARAIHDEVKALEAAGAQYIQIDEPAATTRLDEMPLVIESMGIVTKGIRAKTITHICYGDFERAFDQIARIPVDQVDLEFANRNFELLDLFRRKKKVFTKEIGFGVVDVHSHLIETKEQVKAGLWKALDVFPPERIYPDPDCGLKTRTVAEAKAKLRVMVDAVREVKQQLANGKSPIPNRTRRPRIQACTC